MKRMIVVILMLSLSLFVVACASGDEDFAMFSDNHSIDLVYKNIDVKESHEITTESGNIFKVTVKEDKGKINLSIKDSEGHAVYSGNGMPTSVFEVEIDKSDTYTIEVDGMRVSGELSVYQINIL